MYRANFWTCPCKYVERSLQNCGGGCGRNWSSAWTPRGFVASWPCAPPTCCACAATCAPKSASRASEASTPRASTPAVSHLPNSRSFVRSKRVTHVAPAPRRLRGLERRRGGAGAGGGASRRAAQRAARRQRRRRLLRAERAQLAGRPGRAPRAERECSRRGRRSSLICHL